MLLYLQTLRVQSSEGTKRVDVDPSDTISKLFEKVCKVCNLIIIKQASITDIGILDFRFSTPLN